MPHILDASNSITRKTPWRNRRAALFFILCGTLIPAGLASAATEITSLTLNWTAPGDDSTRGRATAYDLRRSQTPITELSFATATVITGTPAPQTAGAAESFTVTGLTNGVSYFFAMRTRDEAGNWSKISNLASTSTTGVGDGDVALSFGTPFPNPCRQSARFAYSLPRQGEANVEVFDVGGRTIRTLMSGTRPPGRADLVWDLRSDRGDTVAPGVYLVRAKIAGQEWMRRVVVTR